MKFPELVQYKYYLLLLQVFGHIVKGGYLNKELIIYMGGSILIGSLIGSYGSSFLSEEAVNVVYGILALIAAIMMFVPKKQVDDMPIDQVHLINRLQPF